MHLQLLRTIAPQLTWRNYLKCQSVESHVIYNQMVKNNNYWILSKKFDAYEQSVTISPKTSFVISEVINSYCSLIENESERCNPISISEKDIKNLLVIFNDLREKTFDKTKTS